MESVFFIIAQALFFALPFYAANMAPVLVKGIPFLATPIDGGRVWHGQPILGSHKTWRGLAAGVLLAVAVVYAQRFVITYYGLHELALGD